MDLYIFLRDAAQHLNDFALNRRLTRLHLPAVKVGAVVCDDELEIAHGARNYRSRVDASPARRRDMIRAVRPSKAQELWRGTNEATARLDGGTAIPAEGTFVGIIAGN